MGMPAKVVYKDKFCVNCGEGFNRNRSNSGRLESTTDFKIRKYCSHRCYASHHVGLNHHAFKQEGSVRKDGYVRVSLNGRRRYLHRILIEESLGRSLATKEHIHHIDENPKNNSLENLTLTNNPLHRKLHAKSQKRNKYGKFSK